MTENQIIETLVATAPPMFRQQIKLIIDALLRIIDLRIKAALVKE